MTRSPGSLIPSDSGQPGSEKRDDKAFKCRQEGEANLRAATQVNAVTAPSTPPAITPIQLDLFPGRACPLKAKPATTRNTARMDPSRRDGVSGGGTQRQTIELTGETLFGPADATPRGREAYKGRTRKRSNEAGQGIGGGHSTEELRENRREGRAAAFIKRAKQGKAAGLPPQGKAQPRPNRAKRKAPARLDNARKLQRTLYRVAKQQPERRFTLLYDKVCRQDILREAWHRVKSNKGAAGVDQVDIDAIREYGEDRFLSAVERELRSRRYRTALVRRVHIPKPGQPGKTRPLGIPTVKDRLVQMAVKLVIEPLFEADFMPCSFGFRPKKTPRMALGAIVQSVNEGYSFVVDVDLKSYFDTISHELLLKLVECRVGDVQVLRLIRAWLKAGVMEEGKVTHPDRGSPQGGVISPTLSNIFLHEVDRQWCRSDGVALGNVRLVRYADDMALLARTAGTGGVGATAVSVCRSSTGGEPGEESVDDTGGRFRVSWLRVLESSGADAVNVAARKGVPPYPSTGPRSSAIVSVKREGRRGDPEAEPDPEWVAYLFPGLQQQPDIPCGGLGRSERSAALASA